MATRTSHLRDIVEVRQIGSRTYIYLSCGHRVLHNSRVEVPKRKWCGECDVGD